MTSLHSNICGYNISWLCIFFCGVDVFLSRWLGMIYYINRYHTDIYILVVYLTNSSKIRKIYYQEKMILQRALTFWVCWCCCCTVKNIDMATLEYAFAKSHNPNHLGNILLETIDKCYCEPYNKNQSNSRPSIVRFPVSFSQYYIYS